MLTETLTNRSPLMSNCTEIVVGASVDSNGRNTERGRSRESSVGDSDVVRGGRGVANS